MHIMRINCKYSYVVEGYEVLNMTHAIYKLATYQPHASNTPSTYTPSSHKLAYYIHSISTLHVLSVGSLNMEHTLIIIN